MKKLALALVCLVSVAFFASCDKKVEHPEPQIAVLGEGYLQDGDVVECGVEYAYGFRVASNFETQKELSKFVVTCTSGEYVSTLCDSVISGTEFVYEDWVYFEPSKDIIGSVELTAVVTDVDGYTNTATLKIDINKEEDLAVSDLSWVRRGANVSEATEQEMAIMGLQWTGSYKDIMATIKPLNDNCKLYALIDSDVFETINTESELNAFISNLQETTMPVASYRNISTNASANYNDVLVVITEDGIPYLIHITRADIETGSYGTQITITGQFK